MLKALAFGIMLCSLGAVARAGGTPDPGGDQFFEAKIRPLLADHCYKCHSGEAASAGKLKGELLLDSRDGWLKGGKGGAVIVPGKPAQSRLIEAVRYANEDLQMPPKDRLAPAAVADLEKWIAMGAPDPRKSTTVAAKHGVDFEAGKKFWSFQPLHHVEMPTANDPAHWCRTPIDRFVLAMQQQKGLRPNGPAGRAKLIRRACFDLTGLPPTPQEVSAFVTDPSPDAYEKLLDRLLASPHYGERWARHWLDVARFGESDGFEQDYDRPGAYQYRDFVIRAFNSDMPFDRFVQLQIAGDEIAPGDWQAMAATGFLTAGVFPTQITEKEFEISRYNQLDDMVSTTGNAMLGLTVGCARCHDHKYDPIATADYYRMAAAFATAIRSDVEMDLTPPEERAKIRAAWQAKVDDLRDQLARLDQGEVEKKWREAIASAKENPGALDGEWSALEVDSVKTSNGAKYVMEEDGSLRLQGKPPKTEICTLTLPTRLEKITALRLEAMTDKTLPQHGPGAGANGNFALTEIEVRAAAARNGAASVPAKIVRAIATHEQNKGNLSVASSFDGNSSTGWAIDGGGIGKNQSAIFYFDHPVGFPGGTVLTVTLHFEHASPRHLIGRMRLAASSAPEPKELTSRGGIDPAIAQTFSRLAAGETVAASDRDAAREWVARSVKEVQRLKDAVAKLLAEGPPKKLTKVQVTSEGLPPVKNHADDRGYPHFYKSVYLLRRGDPNNKVEAVTESFPRVLMRGGFDESHWKVAAPPAARTSYRRTAMAHWLTDTEYGSGNLLARVIVNRLWQHHFGTGIVATPNDFGAQGERPTHPELLEWLANDLVSHGWEIKRLQKLMMLSGVYTQEAGSSPERTAIDPHNAYLWHFQPHRLEAEPIRDAMLAVSGSLDETMFGPGTLDQSTRRRSIYFTVKRSQLIPMMMVLDWPEALNSQGARPSTTVAPQALLFMNSPQARLYAEGFARRIRSESVADSIAGAYEIAFSRAPEKSELAIAESFIERQAAGYRDAKRPDPQADAMADFCQAIMSANEFVYVD